MLHPGPGKNRGRKKPSILAEPGAACRGQKRPEDFNWVHMHLIGQGPGSNNKLYYVEYWCIKYTLLLGPPGVWVSFLINFDEACMSQSPQRAPTKENKSRPNHQPFTHAQKWGTRVYANKTPERDKSEGPLKSLESLNLRDTEHLGI